MTEQVSLSIERIGARGDGVAAGPDGAVYVPFALPGETWVRHGDGTFECVSQSAHRREAPCPYFTRCGGCVGQHMDRETYAAWKTGLVTEAFAHQGIAVEPHALWQADEGTRRRVVLTAISRGGVVELGFREAGSHALVNIDRCLVAEARIVSVFGVVRELVASLARGRSERFEARVAVLAADNGLDVVIVPEDKLALASNMRAVLAEVGTRAGLLRLTVAGQDVMQQGEPVLAMSGVDVIVPPGVFLQAVGTAEAYMADRVCEALKRAKSVADLFCGAGAFSFGLARRAKVFASDSDGEALAALEHAKRHAKGLKPIEVRRRDLFREPLSRGELNAFDGIVFDPPRAGAAAQAEAIAKSKVPVVAAVSCNPATLARDARTLIDGGYRLESVQPVDQFVYSAHVEVVAVFRR